MLAIYKPGESEDIPSVFAWYILPGELGSHPVLTPHRISLLLASVPAPSHLTFPRRHRLTAGCCPQDAAGAHHDRSGIAIALPGGSRVDLTPMLSNGMAADIVRASHVIA